jgi:energy-coupling factor transport system substrate-specific component
MQLLKLKEWLVVIGFVFGGAILRGPMQAIPSAEPITFFAILSGWLFGKKKGFITGATAGYLSNFIMLGGQGPWTVFQMFAWGIAGFLGGVLKNIKPKGNYLFFWLKSILPILGIVAVSTLLFDLILNVSWAFFMPFSILTLIISGLPFLLIHLVSNVGFALFLPLARKVVYEKGRFNEMEICRAIVNRFNSRPRVRGEED